MEQWSANTEIDGRQAIPRTDGWVRVALGVVSVSLLWTVAVFLFAALSDACASSGDQCTLALSAAIAWGYPQVIVAPLQLAGLVVLTRYALRGNHAASAGLKLFFANCVLSGLLCWYLTTLPFYFR